METFHDRRTKKRLDIAGGIIQALTIALVLATISTVLKLDKHVCVMDQEYQTHRETMKSLSAAIESHDEKLSKNCNRLTAIESKYVEVVELKLVWEQFAEIKGDVIKNSLTINPSIQTTLNDINQRLAEIERTLHR